MHTLVLHLFPGPDGRVELLPALLANGGGLTALPPGTNRPARDELLQAGGAVLRELREAGPRIAAGGPAAALTPLRERLQPAGARLAEVLFDASLLDLLTRDTHLTHLAFWLDPALNGLPLESAFLGNEFLGFRFAVGREVVARGRRGAIPRSSPTIVRALAVLPPPGHLPPGTGHRVTTQYATFHREWLQAARHRLIDFPDARCPELPQFLDLLAQHDIVNLVGHHVRPPGSPEQNGFPLVDGHVFTAADLARHFRSPALQPPALLFSMGCDSGLTVAWENHWAEDGPLHGLVDAALRVGIRHHIGALIEFPADRGGDFFAPFYDALVLGLPVGEALRRVRLALRGGSPDWRHGNTALGLSLVLYGDPTRPWFSAAPQPVGTEPTILCEHPLDGTLCGRAAIPAERGFAQRRCVHHLQGLACSAGHPVASATDLTPCSFQDPLGHRCANTLCPRCRGTKDALCWEHCCHEGHRIDGVPARRCRDPHGQHPGESRSVCPRDDGFHDHLCRPCYELDRASRRSP